MNAQPNDDDADDDGDLQAIHMMAEQLRRLPGGGQTAQHAAALLLLQARLIEQLQHELEEVQP